MAKKKKPTETPKPVAKPNNSEGCPPGYVWDNVLKKCVPDDGRWEEQS